MKDIVRKWLTDQFGDDAALHAELYGQYAANMKAAAARLPCLLADGNLAQFAGTAHAMKGMALQLGDNDVAGLCKALQSAGQAGDASACAANLPAVRAAVDEL